MPARLDTRSLLSTPPAAQETGTDDLCSPLAAGGRLMPSAAADALRNAPAVEDHPIDGARSAVRPCRLARDRAAADRISCASGGFALAAAPRLPP
jgi:hypothetical protein